MIVTPSFDYKMYRGPQFNTQMAKPTQKVTMVNLLLKIDIDMAMMFAHNDNDDNLAKRKIMLVKAHRWRNWPRR